MNKRMLCLVFGITLLVTMGISSLIPALPLLARTFNVSLESSWRIIAAFALPGLICIPLAGVWADRFGRKKVLIPALLLFAGGGVCCMFATSYMELLIYRMVQGVGSAPLGLLYSTIIADTWTGKERARAMGLNAMVLGLGTAISPACGGALAMLDWRLPFLLPLLALPVAWFAWRLPLMVPDTRTTLGAYFKASWACTRNRQTLVLLCFTLLTFIMLSGPIITCFPMLAEAVFKATALEIGMIIAAASLASGLAASQLPRLYRHFSTRALLLASLFLYAVAFCTIPLYTNVWWLILPILLYGFGQGINIPLASTLLTGQAPDEQRASLMAANAILLRLAQNIGPSVFGTLAASIGAGNAIAAGTIVALAMAVLVVTIPLPPIAGYEAEVVV